MFCSVLKKLNLGNSFKNQILKMSTGVQQPHWKKPISEATKSPLKLYNSLTRSKEEFIPIDEEEVTWYSCGATVYDWSHMGHARNYVTIDINRRILQDYFGYNILFIQNVTDIDDKIIIKSRQEHLFGKFVEENKTITEDLIAQINEAWTQYVSKNLSYDSSSDFTEFCSKLDITTNAKFPMYIKLATRAQKALKEPKDIKFLLEEVKDVVVPMLDTKYGSSITDLGIFRKTSSHWEQKFDQDMERLNVLPPNVVTRVSEYVPEIVDFVSQIIERGYAYATKDGSVYFDCTKFDHSTLHDYAKLQPWNKADKSLLEEGEGSLTVADDKLSSSDFALWKSSKPGEPFWDSPWGKGRPGWHIECSVMATSIAPNRMDIHSGGIDLLFPHHDNEIAQTELYYDSEQWVNYFLHTGHLHIEGQKMSKSLKNFITIDEALQKNSARQLRLCFALVQWNNQLDFKESLLNEVKSIESTFNKFFSTVRGLNNDYKHDLANGVVVSKKLGAKDFELALDLKNYKKLIDEAFRDNLSTPKAVRLLIELVAKSNNYIQTVEEIRIQSLINVVNYITKILSVIGFEIRSDRLGWIDDQLSSQGSVEDIALPFVKVLSSFRDTVRSSAIAKEDYSVLLKLCDEVRDKDLLKLGVSLDDRSSTGALIKFLDESEKSELIKQQELSAKILELKLAKQALNKLKEEAKQLEKLAKSKISPLEMFKIGENSGKYSEYDEQGIPTKDSEGVEITKSARKKLVKLWDLQNKLHQEYLNN